jgi:uncharacterized protein YqeY
MGILEDVSSQMKDAMRARDKARLAGLRGIRAAFIEGMKKTGADALDDDVCVTILRRLAKQRKESLETYVSAGRDDLAAVERTDLEVIETFLPRLADAETTRTWAAAAIAQTGASSIRETGKVMGALMRAHKGEVDGTAARKAVQELLA